MRYLNNKGITLIALVVTIIVLLILAGITISTLTGENGIFKNAKKAKYETIMEQEKEQVKLAYISAVANEPRGEVTASELQTELDKEVGTDVEDNGDGTLNVLFNNTNHNYNVDRGNVTKVEKVTSPYEDKEWVMAWTCTDGVWSDEINRGEKAEGNIVAKLYETGKKITPPTLYYGDEEYSFKEGNEYKMVIEGKGSMGVLMTTSDNNITSVAGWQTQTALFMMRESDTCITPYITEAIICEGITNVGAYAFGGATALANVTISDSVLSIDEGAFMYDSSLKTVKIPKKVTTIGCHCFARSGLNQVTIPASVNKLEAYAFYFCENLSTVKIYSQNVTIGEPPFKDIMNNSIIYVKNENIKNELEGKYYPDRTTIKIME